METESVWDYPRPPKLEKTKNLIVVEFGGTLVETRDAYRVLETSHPPTYYIQAEDFLENALKAVSGSTFCEWKGEARYFDIQAPNGKIASRAPGITHLHPKIFLNSRVMLRSIPQRWNGVLLTVKRSLLRKGIFMEAGSLPGFKDLSKEDPGPSVGDKNRIRSIC